MKRSEINQLILSSIDFFNRMNFKLPPWAVASGRFACIYVGGTWLEANPGEKERK